MKQRLMGLQQLQYGSRLFTSVCLILRFMQFDTKQENVCF